MRSGIWATFHHLKNPRIGVVLLVALLLASCGGFGNSSATPAQEQGRVRITIKWPKLDRTIPNATNSITITAVELVPDEENEGFTEDEELNVKIVPRPEGDDAISVTVLDLPAIKVRLKAKAFENGLGTGQVIASGSTDVQVPGAGASVGANITLDVAVTQITVEPSSLTMEPDGNEVLVATVKDADGNTILVDSDDLLWSSTNTNVAIVSQRAAPNGDTADVSAVQGGSTTIRVTHSPNGVFKDVAVSIPTGVTISPPSAVIATGGTKQFTAAAVGAPSAEFTWSVTGGGSISNTGLFTSNGTSGNFTVTATLVGDSSKTASASVRVGLPPLFAQGYSGITTTNGGNPNSSSILFEFIGGELNWHFFVGPNQGTFPVHTMTETSFSMDLSQPGLLFTAEGNVTVAGNTATLTMIQKTHNVASGLGLQTTTFVGTRPIN